MICWNIIISVPLLALESNIIKYYYNNFLDSKEIMAARFWRDYWIRASVGWQMPIHIPEEEAVIEQSPFVLGVQSVPVSLDPNWRNDPIRIKRNLLACQPKDLRADCFEEIQGTILTIIFFVHLRYQTWFFRWISSLDAQWSRTMASGSCRARGMLRLSISRRCSTIWPLFIQGFNFALSITSNCHYMFINYFQKYVFKLSRAKDAFISKYSMSIQFKWGNALLLPTTQLQHPKFAILKSLYCASSAGTSLAPVESIFYPH